MHITVLAKTKAKKTEVKQVNETTYLVSVTASPVKGAANEAIITALADHFQVRKNRVFLTAGFTSPVKSFTVQK